MEEILVITDMNDFDENIYYCGNSELEAFKKYRALKGKFRKVNIIKASVEKKLFNNVPFIWNYAVITIIK